LLVGQPFREQRHHQRGGVSIDQRIVLRGWEADLGSQAVDQLGPRASRPLEGATQWSPERRAEGAEAVRQFGKTGEQGRVVGREEAHRCNLCGGPRDSLLVGHEPGGECDPVGDQEVRTTAQRRQRILVALTDGRQDQFPEDSDRAPPEIHEPPHHGGVGHEVRVGPESPEPEPRRLDLPAVALPGRQHGLVAPCLEAEGDGEVGVEVAERAERGEDDPLARGGQADQDTQAHEVLPSQRAPPLPVTTDVRPVRRS
jgi:hypothetical protein